MIQAELYNEEEEMTVPDMSQAENGLCPDCKGTGFRIGKIRLDDGSEVDAILFRENGNSIALSKCLCGGFLG